MKVLLIFFGILLVTPSFAEKFKCLSFLEEYEFFNQIEPDAYCAIRDGMKIKFFNKYKKNIKKAIEKRRQLFIKSSKNLSHSMSPSLLQAHLLGEDGERIAFYYNSYGEGYEAKFFDNGADYFQDGLSRIVHQGKIGFINKKGSLILSPQYVFALPFENGYSKVCQKCNKKKQGEYSIFTSDDWFYINKEGTEFDIIPKELKLPFDVMYQKRLFGDNYLHNSNELRRKLRSKCGKEPQACLNYATALFESFFAYDLGQFQLSSHAFSQFSINSPSHLKLTKKKVLLLLKKLSNKHIKISSHYGISLYMLGYTKVAFDILARACKRKQPESCFYAARLSDHQLDFNNALFFYQKACLLKVTLACENQRIIKPLAGKAKSD